MISPFLAYGAAQPVSGTFHPRLTITTGSTDAVVEVVRQEFERVGS